MSDSKQFYSDNSNDFITKTISNSDLAKHQYDVSKKKEMIYNEDWKKHMVNINDVVDQFVPNSKGYVNDYKYIYDGDRYQVVADMVAGYLRIKDKKTNQYIKLDGKPGSQSATHFKIKKREEM